MHVYVGKLNWFEYAQNECITVVFPAGFALKGPVCAYWQWTVDATGNVKSNCTQEGFITIITNTTDQYYVHFTFSYYAFEGSVSADFRSLSLKMLNPGGHAQDVWLSLLHSDAVCIPSISVFTGKLHWFEYSQNEMVTLVIPGEVADGKPVILSHQWTKDAMGNVKTNHTFSSTLRTVNVGLNGDLSTTFSNGYYTFDFTFRKGTSDIVLSMANPSGVHDSRAPYILNRAYFRDLHELTSNQDPQLVFCSGSSKSGGDGIPSQTVNHYIFGGQGGGGGQGGVHGGGGGLGEGPTLQYHIKAGHLTMNVVHTSGSTSSLSSPIIESPSMEL